MSKNQTKRKIQQQGQAAIETIFSILVVLLLMLASAQILYTSLLAGEAMKRAHGEMIRFVRDMNSSGYTVQTALKEKKGKITADPGKAYGRVVNNWSLFHKEYKPAKMPSTKYSNEKKYEAERGIVIAAGPLKGVANSAFGVLDMPRSDGDGYNKSGEAIRNDELENLCRELGIFNSYF